MPNELRCDVVSSELLERLAAAPLPLAVPCSANSREFFRELYLDSPDDLLQRRGVSCRLRISPDGAARLIVDMGSRNRPGEKLRKYSAPLASPDVRAALSTPSEPVRRLSSITDPRQLQVRVEIDVEGQSRFAGRDLLRRFTAVAHFEQVKVRTAGATRTFHQLRIESLRGDGRLVQKLGTAYSSEYGLRVASADMRERAQLLLKWMESEEKTRPTRNSGGIALVLTNGASVGMLASDGALSLPSAPGFGVGSARTLLADYAGAAGTDPRLVGSVNCIGERSKLEVWAAELHGDSPAIGRMSWLPLSEALFRTASGAAPNADAVSALALLFRSGVIRSAALPAKSDGPAAGVLKTMPTGTRRVEAEAAPADAERRFLNSEISLLDFNTRVLALAEDLNTPLVERFRFLSIVSANIDEFFMVRVAALKQLALESPEELGANELNAQEQLELIADHCSALVARQYRCFEACMAELASHGTRIRSWEELGDAQRAELREYFHEEVFPSLTPMAMTMSAGHPFPRLSHLSLSLAVVLLDARGGAPHFAHVELPADLPRFRTLDNGGVIGTEELVRANLDLLYPRLEIEQSFLFRVTRGADITLDEDNAWSLLHAVDEASKRRFENPVVRVEVESAMPAVIRELVLKELQREHGGSLSSADIYEVPGLLDLQALSQLEMPSGARLRFPKLATKNPFSDFGNVWDCIRERDRLVHHPFEEFGQTVVRFFEDAAADPDVVAIKATLYRVGEESPIVAALIAAAQAGKDVVTFVELKARFEEERNVGWAKKLQEAGGKMVFGFVGLKTHAKSALIVRRESGKLRQYVHIGTGNYNAQTAKQYTDFSLFSADASLAGDIHDLFNELTGSASAPQPLSRGCLIAPRQLLPALLERIEKEAARARAGNDAVIRFKLNGLSDPDIIEALYRASQDGVRIELVVRGICTLRPGAPGLSERISVVSVVGRFLEHERIYQFGSGGEAEYFIGSPDLRPRNLRRRIELVAPVRDPACRAQLDRILGMYLADPSAWELSAGGEYVRRSGASAAAEPAQQQLQMGRANR